MSILLTLAWPAVGLTLVLLANARVRAWQRLREPLAQQQYDALVTRMADLEKAISVDLKAIQSEVSSVALQRGITRYEG